MTTELKPCPFCGGAAKLKQERTGQGHGESYDVVIAGCTVCTASVRFAGYYQHETSERCVLAVEAWNARVFAP